jgi:hypothetical protein
MTRIVLVQEQQRRLHFALTLAKGIAIFIAALAVSALVSIDEVDTPRPAPFEVGE